MEGNRDEAEKCVEIAREALNAGNREKAQRFLQKAEKLYPLPSARGEALGVPSLLAGFPDRRVASPRPHHRPFGNQRGPGSARPVRGTPRRSIVTHPRPGPSLPGLGWGWAPDSFPETPPAAACLRDAGSHLTGESCRFPDPFSGMSGCYSPKRMALGDSSGPVLALAQ